MIAQRLRVIVSRHWVSNRFYLTVSIMFNRLRTIWPKGYQRGSPGKSHQNGDYLKTSNAKNGSSGASALVAFRQGHREGGSEVRQWRRCPWTLGGPLEGPWALRGPWTSGGLEMILTNQFVEHRRPFFFRDHIKIRRQLWHFPLLFWSSQSWKCPIFELTLGLRLALGAPTNN